MYLVLFLGGIYAVGAFIGWIFKSPKSKKRHVHPTNPVDEFMDEL